MDISREVAHQVQVCSLIFVFILIEVGLCGADSYSNSTGINGEEQSISMLRTLSGSGFHRNIHTTFSIQKWFLEKNSGKLCQLLLKETLPSGVYADPFQLKQMEPSDGPKVLFDRPVNIEAAEYVSQSHDLSVFLGPLSGETIVITLGVHGRYHHPSDEKSSTHSQVRISHPRLYSTCSFTEKSEAIDAPCTMANTSVCKWSYVSYHTKSPVLKLEIPHGQSKDKPLVVLVTLVVTVGVCAILIKKLFTVQDSDHNKHS